MSNKQSKVVTGARLVLGAGFLVFGLNGFLQFLPQPPAPPAAAAFGGALFATGYMFPLIKGVEVVSALLLLSNRFVPLALTLLAPILVNIVLFHAFLAPAGLLPGLLLTALTVFLAYQYRSAYAPMLRAVVSPDETPRSDRRGAGAARDAAAAA